MIKNKDMVYDSKRKRYRLAEEYVLNELGTDLDTILYDEMDSNPSTLPERTLKYTSNMVYDYMKANCADYNYATKLIETEEEINEAFKDVLSHQLMYFIQMGDLALSADGDTKKMLSKRSIEILKGYGLLTNQDFRPKHRCGLYNHTYFYGGGGGIY
ncbi:MAG: hypothetical protein J6A98_00700 [Clostridia bacterium]|nr:hypothetical protein [Clostridia bacterium]